MLSYLPFLIAPEYILNNNVSQSNDMFALGCLAYAVHNKGASVLKTFNNYHSYEKQVKSINAHSFASMPPHLQPVLASLLTRLPNQRMTPIEFQNSKYFDNILVSTIRFLENFPEKTREEKAQFMKGLSKVLSQFPERVIRRKVRFICAAAVFYITTLTLDITFPTGRIKRLAIITLYHT